LEGNPESMRVQACSVVAVIVFASACRIGEHIADRPPDAGGGGDDDDAPIVDGGDLPDASPTPGLHAIIGEKPEWSGTCTSLDDRAEMEDRFDPPVQAQDVTAGWDFDTEADIYNDPSFHFAPNWTTAESGRFSVRFSGTIALEPGTHCFSIDIGATGTDIIGGKNACGQIYLGTASAPLAETGFDAASVDAAVGCTDASGPTEIDIVFWYFNIFERAKLVVRHCAGAGCTPDQAIEASATSPSSRPSPAP
jgi:hypothetical protein